MSDESSFELIPISRIVDVPFERKGTLDRIPFIRLIYHVYRERLTGTLRLESEAIKKLVTFEKGEPRFVVSNLEKECLGQVLVKKGRLTQEECNRSLDTMAKLKKRQGETLIQLGLLEPYELDEALKQQAREKFNEVFSWRNGSFVFVEGKTFRKELTPVDLSVPQLCIRGVKEFYNLPVLQREMASFLHDVPSFSNEPVFQIEEFKLATWDAKVVREMKAGRNMKEVIDSRIVRDLDVYHLFFAFYALSVITFSDAPPKKKAAKPAEKPAPEKEKKPPAPVAAQKSEPAKTDWSAFSSNPYEVLGIPESATDDEIRNAFQKQLPKFRHEAEESEEVRNLRMAYELIGTYQGRRDYVLRTFKEGKRLPEWAKENFGTDVILTIGKSLFEQRRYDDAILVFKNGVELHADNGQLLCYFGFALIIQAALTGEVDKKDFISWKKIVIKGTKLSPNEAEVHYVMGRVFHLEGDVDNALIAFNRACTLDPNHKKATSEVRLLNMRASKRTRTKREVSKVKWKS